jgi:integrase/recombinase XerD
MKSKVAPDDFAPPVQRRPAAPAEDVAPKRAAARRRGGRPSVEIPSASWTSEVEAFLTAKVVETPVGENWIRRMRWELDRVPRLLLRLDSGRVPDQVQDVAPEHILAIRKGMKWEKATFAVHFAALRQLLRWGGNPVGQAKNVWRLPAGQPSRRRWLTKVQFERLISAAEGSGQLLVALEGVNGLRRVEVLRLRKKDVLLEEGCLRVLGKGRDGGKWRSIPMHPLVQELLNERVRSLTAEERLFPLSNTGADLLLQRAARKAGFPLEGVKVSHHDLRRTFGRLAHQSGMDLIQLKNLFGHSSVEMTVHYIGMDADVMRQGLNRIVLLPWP